MRTNSLPISVIFLTLNEEYHLPKAIDNIKPWVEEIFVVDSLSDDRTIDIALEKDVKVVQRPFTNFGDQWNYALENLPVETEWTMKMDPDERMTEPLLREIKNIVLTKDKNFDAFKVKLQLYFMGQPLPVYNEVVRLWRTGKAKFSEVLVNEHLVVDGNVGKTQNNLIHLDSKNLEHWYNKQNDYTTREAMMKIEDHELADSPSFFGTSFQRRMFFKKHFYDIPFRYFLLKCYLFFKHKIWLAWDIGRIWIDSRIEVMKMVEKKYKEMKLRGLSIYREQKSNNKREFDDRILNSKLQKKFYTECAE